MEFERKFKSVIGIGNPIMDIIAPISKEILEKYKIDYGKTTYLNENNKGFLDELAKQKDVVYSPGGSIQNTLRICSWCLNLIQDPLKEKKYQLTMLGCVGNDKYKDILVEELQKAKIKTLYEVTNYETSTCGVGICNKERSLLSNIKASGYLSKEFVHSNMNKILSHDIFMIEGYFILEKFDMIMELIQEFKKQGKPVILTFSAVFVVKTAYEKLKKIADNSDIIFCNDSEAKAFAGVDESSNDYEKISLAIHQKLGRLKGRMLVITCGNIGANVSVYSYKDQQMKGILHYFPEKKDKVEIVDTNGAGDAFMGGFTSSFMRNKDFFTCSKTAAVASWHILRREGCTFDPNIRFRTDI